MTNGHCVQPIVKWPGGKRSLLPLLLPHCPIQFRRYFEPFVGGGALFFALAPRDAILNDINPDLMNFYQALKQHPEALLRRVMRLSNDAQTYYRIRDERATSRVGRAARFLYLNKTCFNGLYRTNRQNHFNVPFGHNSRPVIPSAFEFKRSAATLQRAAITCDDFEATCSRAQRGDFVFLDPPYTVAHNNNGFIRYNAHLFGWRDQLRLRNVVESLATRGVHVLVTNAAHRSIKHLFRDFRQTVVDRRSLLSADPRARRVVQELIIATK